MYQESNSHWLLVVFAEYVCSRMDFYSVSLHASWTHFFRIGQCCMMYYFKENCTVSCVLWLKLLISSLKCIISANWVCKVKGPFKKKKKKCRILKIILCSFFKSWVIGECGCEGYGTQPVKQNITGTCPLLDMLAINTRSQVASANVRVWMQLCVCVKKKKIFKWHSLPLFEWVKNSNLALTPKTGKARSLLLFVSTLRLKNLHLLEFLNSFPLLRINFDISVKANCQIRASTGKTAPSCPPILGHMTQALAQWGTNWF